MKPLGAGKVLACTVFLVALIPSPTSAAEAGMRFPKVRQLCVTGANGALSEVDAITGALHALSTKNLIVHLVHSDIPSVEEFQRVGIPVTSVYPVRLVPNVAVIALDESVPFVSVAAAVSEAAFIDDVEIPRVKTQFASPSDPRYSIQWYLGQLGVSRAWDITVGVNSVTVAVIVTCSPRTGSV